MITGSHNPAEYNGFKIGIGKTTLCGSEIQELRKLIESGCFVYGQGTLRSWNIINSYHDFIRQDIHITRQGMKIVIDAGNGVGGQIAVPLFQSLGFEVVPLYCEMDGRFPNHHPDPTIIKNMSPLIDKVIQERASVGIAYDGDADRIGVVNEKGIILWGDELMILFAKEVLREEPGATIIGEAKCSMRMYDAIAQHGGRAIMWKAGHSIIKAKMQEENAPLAGEMSGHIFWKHRYYGFDDAVYTSARLLEIMSRSNKTLSEMFSDIPPTFATPELHFPIPEEKKFEMVSRAVQYFQQNGYTVIDVDGVRVVFPDGWGLVRASNTQPMLVLRFEAHTEERMKEIRALVESVLLDIKNSL
jgi:phosphomannomutase/phosphoglucomutase